MLFSRSARYALAALTHLSTRDDRTPILIRDLAREIGAPYHYLSKITQLLVRHGMVASVRGPNGGLVISGSPEEIRIGDVVDAIDGPDSLRHCLLGSGNCDADRKCALHDTWAPVRQRNLDFVYGTTIAEITTGNPG